jgi:predicted nicotinamide N-methyase
MPYYIRFLKPPKQQGRKVKTVVKICNDLGEVALEDFNFTAIVVDINQEEGNEVCASRDYSWKAGMYELRIELDLVQTLIPNEGIECGEVILYTADCPCVIRRNGQSSEKDEDMCCDDDWCGTIQHDENEFVAVEGPFAAHRVFVPSLEHTICQRPMHKLIGAKASLGLLDDRYFMCEFQLCDFQHLEIAQEFKESISGHIWLVYCSELETLGLTLCYRDGGLALVSAINHFMSLALSSDAIYATKESKKTISVLELGSGTGLVGCAMLSLLKRCKLIATDLPDSLDVLNKTILETGPQDTTHSDDSDESDEEYAHLPSHQRAPKNWLDQIHKEIAVKPLEWQSDSRKLPLWIQSPQDVVIIADCTYNPSSYEALITTLTTITNASPHALIIYASKRRHSNEFTFEEMLCAKDFIVKQSWIDTHLDSEEVIDIKTFLRRYPDGKDWSDKPPDWIPYHPLEGFWWTPKQVIQDGGKKGFLRALADKAAAMGDRDWETACRMGRKDIQ